MQSLGGWGNSPKSIVGGETMQETKFKVTNKSFCIVCRKTVHSETHEVTSRPLNKEIIWQITCDKCKGVGK